MDNREPTCRDCGDGMPARREFLRAAGAAVLAAGAVPLWATPRLTAAPTPKSTAETAAKALFESLTDDQRKKICFDWDFVEEGRGSRGLLRTFVSNNWSITPQRILSDFYTKKQQDLIHDVFKGLINPEWYDRFLRQLKDDTGGKPWGAEQSIALFGKPGDEHFEMVMTGRHMTLRADGNCESSVAFGGPIFYGHAAQGFNESGSHKGNVFWPQALLANDVYKMLDEKQRQEALVKTSPRESAVGFRKPDEKAPGIAVASLSDDQKKAMQKVLAALVEPFRQEDRDEALEALKKQGGLDKCRLSFFADADVDNDEVWDNWRLEGPSFVWYFRGDPHVHVWVNVADDPTKAKLNARG
jgi:hypothetical protein